MGLQTEMGTPIRGWGFIFLSAPWSIGLTADCSRYQTNVDASVTLILMNLKGDFMKLFFVFTMAITLSSSQSFASQLTYLKCDLPSYKEIPEAHFDFTLDERNSTVSFYVKKANATNTEKAVFGSQKITWTNNTQFVKVTRTISRTDLSFVQEVDVAGKIIRQIGTCSIVTTIKNKF